MRLPKPNAWISCGLVMACLAYMCAVGYRTHRQAQVAAVRSCLLSMIGTLATRPEIFTNLAQADDEWRELAGANRQRLFDELESSGKLDCSAVRRKEGVSVDLWGDAILVSFKRESSHATQWRFVSIGPDGRFGTEDDISVCSP